MEPTTITVAVLTLAYLILVRALRYQRSKRISSDYGYPKRPLGEMTLSEASSILLELEQLEFPFSFMKGRDLALLKSGCIPTMTKLFMATGQSNSKNATKRLIDTKIILQEAQLNGPESDRQLQAIARMNFFHDRYRKAGKILDEDLLHTLGDGVVETVGTINKFEWRKLMPVEMCAMGVFHKGLGDAMRIPFTPLPSSTTGWRDGIHFAEELMQWVVDYEKKAAIYSPLNEQFLKTYIYPVTWFLPSILNPVIYGIVASELSDTVRKAMGLDKPNMLLSSTVNGIKRFRKYFLRHLVLPRSKRFAVNPLDQSEGDKYQYSQITPEPWYTAADSKQGSSLPGILRRVAGGTMPGPAHFKPDGYDLKTIGPAPQEGKGIAEMEATVMYLRSLNRGASCPFHRK